MSLYPADFRPSFRWPFTPCAANDNDTLRLYRLKHDALERAVNFVKRRAKALVRNGLRLVRA